MTNAPTQRPNRHQMLRLFFPPEPTSGAGVGFRTKGDIEAAEAINLRTCEAILTDLIGLFDDGFDAEGRGILAINLQTGAPDPHYHSLPAAEADHAEAYARGEGGGFLLELVHQIQEHDHKKAALFLLIDNSRAQVLSVNREYPAAPIAQLMKEVRQ